MASNTGCAAALEQPRVMASASITTAPRSASSADTVDFPEPIPPVSPMSSTART